MHKEIEQSETVYLSLASISFTAKPSVKLLELKKIFFLMNFFCAFDIHHARWKVTTRSTKNTKYFEN